MIDVEILVQAIGLVGSAVAMAYGGGRLGANKVAVGIEATKADHEERLQKLTKLEQDRDSRLASLENNVSRLSDEKGQLLVKIGDLETSLARNESELSKCKLQLTLTQQSLDTTAKALLDCTQALTDALNEVKALRKQLPKPSRAKKAGQQ